MCHSVIDPVTLRESHALSIELATCSDYIPLASDGSHLYVLYQSEVPVKGTAAVPEFCTMVAVFVCDRAAEKAVLRPLQTLELHVPASLKRGRVTRFTE